MRSALVKMMNQKGGNDGDVYDDDDAESNGNDEDHEWEGWQ